jgi:DNA-directed RNA polymerase specialized sigma24 family protein
MQRWETKRPWRRMRREHPSASLAPCGMRGTAAGRQQTPDRERPRRNPAKTLEFRSVAGSRAVAIRPPLKPAAKRDVLPRSILAGRHRLRSRWNRPLERPCVPGSDYRLRKAMTNLDHRLYAWLLETDERRFELAFNAYFSVAYPAVLRRLARVSGWDVRLLEEAAQDALYKFFERVGPGRRTASETVRATLAALRPLPIGPFHGRLVFAWAADVSAFRSESMGFGAKQFAQPGDPDWKAAVRTLADRIPPLLQRGWQLLDGVRLHLHWSIDEALDSHRAVNEAQRASGAAAGDPSQLARKLVSDVVQRTERVLEMEMNLPGLTQFVDCASTVLATLPRLRVPTNAYLFEIATTTFLDECKHRGRRKRSGNDTVTTKDGAAAADSGHVPDPIDPFRLDTVHEHGDERGADEDAGPAVQTYSARAAELPASDPTLRIEEEQFFERFCAYLRTPVDRAADAYRAADAAGGGAAERRKLEALSGKLSRTLEVLSMIGEGYTQEQTAARMGLSRNQVKYVIELVQEAYVKFAASAEHPPVPKPEPGIHSHAH